MLIIRNVIAAVTLMLGVILTAGPIAQQPAEDAGRGRGQGRGAERPPAAAPLALADRTGFTPMFDGTSLKGWDGDPRYWRAENGAILGESTPEKAVTEN